MLVTTIALGLLMQGPQIPEMKPWVDRGYDSAQPQAEIVKSFPELSKAEAWEAAQAELLAVHAEKLRVAADSKAELAAAPWLPKFFRDRVVRRWTAEQSRRIKPRVLDTDLVVRDHGGDQSFQAFLLVDKIASKAMNTRKLNQQLRREEKRVLVKGGGVVGLWGLLGFAVLWLDRLTRGYMTKRLYVLGGMLALAGPALLLVV